MYLHVVHRFVNRWKPSGKSFPPRTTQCSWDFLRTFLPTESCKVRRGRNGLPLSHINKPYHIPGHLSTTMDNYANENRWIIHIFPPNEPNIDSSLARHEARREVLTSSHEQSLPVKERETREKMDYQFLISCSAFAVRQLLKYRAWQQLVSMVSLKVFLGNPLLMGYK